jgi:hypothetical protein
MTNDDEKLKVENSLKAHGADQPCSRCQGLNFTILKGPVVLFIEPDAWAAALSRHVPCDAVVCAACGHVDLYVSQILHGDKT